MRMGLNGTVFVCKALYPAAVLSLGFLMLANGAVAEEPGTEAAGEVVPAPELQSLLPDQFGGMLSLLPERLPRSKPLPEMVSAVGKRRARVALLTGCVQQVLAPRINWSTLRVLAINGVEVLLPRDQGCCGALLMHMGEQSRALRLARNNLSLL